MAYLHIYIGRQLWRASRTHRACISCLSFHLGTCLGAWRSVLCGQPCSHVESLWFYIVTSLAVSLGLLVHPSFYTQMWIPLPSGDIPHVSMCKRQIDLERITNGLVWALVTSPIKISSQILIVFKVFVVLKWCNQSHKRAWNVTAETSMDQETSA